MISNLALIFFIIFLLVYFFFAGSIIYHLRRYGTRGDLTKKMSIIFLAVSLILICLSLIFFFSIDWNNSGGVF